MAKTHRHLEPQLTAFEVRQREASFELATMLVAALAGLALFLLIWRVPPN
jgi:hypothetical protein